MPQPNAPSTPETRTLGALVWSIVGCICVAILAHWVIADDQWWHIATGRLILARGSIPDTDPFSFTYFGQRWVNWEWLFGVIVAATWDSLGVPGLYLLRVITTGVCVGATAAHMLRDQPRTSRSFALLVLTLLVLCMQYRIGDRPHTFGFAFLALTFLLAEAWLERRSWWRALGLFGVFLVWANTHPSFVYGLLVLGCMSIDRTLDDVLSAQAASKRVAIRFAQLAFIGSSALGIPHLVEHLQSVGTTLADPVSSEWTSIAMHATHGHPWMYAFFALLALLVATVVVDRRQRRSTLTLLLGALAVLAFVYSRFVVEFAIVASVVVYRSCLPAALRLESRLRVRPALVHALVGLCALVAIEAETRHTYGQFAFGLDELGNPVTQVDFMRAQGMRGKVFAPGRGDSAYLTLRMWPEVQIFMDGRVPQVYPLEFAEHHTRITNPEVFGDAVARYDIDHIVVDKGTFTPFGHDWGERLEQHGGFALVYFDERGMVWTRARRAGLACKSCRAVKHLKPWRTDHNWIVNEFPKQPFDEVWNELNYLVRVTNGDPVLRALITTLIEDGKASEPDQERLRALLAEATQTDATQLSQNQP